MDVRGKLVELLLQEDDVCEPSDCKYCGVKGSCGYYRTADRLIANGVTVQEWISVEDRLPKNEKPVLTFVGYEESMIGFITVSSYFCFEPNPHWQWDGLLNDEQKTLFWMPLPQTPKGE